MTKAFIGAWELVAWYEITADGRAQAPLGDTAVGQIIYTADGHVSAQIMERDLERFSSDDWREASLAESGTAWKGYFGYFGRYVVDEARETVTHHILGAWFPNLVGTQQVRHYRFEDRRLVLDADTAWGRVRVVWQRF